MTVKYYGSDGTVKELNAADYTVSKVDTMTTGVKTLTVTYKNLKAEITLTILKKEEGGDTEESSDTQESSTEDEDDSPYADNERTDLKSVNTVIADIKAKVYDGNAYEPVVKVTATVDGKKTTLTEGADYRVLYEKNTNAGEGKVTIKGNGIYKGQIDKTFTISQKPVKKLKFLTGGVVGTPDASTALPIYVYDGAVRLTEGKDYMLSGYQTG